jgi:plasmid maintenance system antidote protein VapI
MKRILNVMLLSSVAMGLSTLSAAASKLSLTNSEVKALTKTATTPEDHLKLARYYDQKSESLLIESRKHEEMAADYRKNPIFASNKFFNRTLGHCEYLAKSDRESGEQMRLVALAHRADAQGAEFASIPVSTAFAAPQAASPKPATEPKVNLTKKQVMALIEAAKTPEDHLKLARYYDQQAAQLLAQSKEHHEMAEAYRRNGITNGSKFAASTVGHCEYFAKSDRDASEKMKELAASHREMAANAGK